MAVFCYITPMTEQATTTAELQLRLFKRSWIRQLRLGEIVDLLGPTHDQICLDVGSDPAMSYHLRELGGTWYSACPDGRTTQTLRGMVGERVEAFSMPKLPFQDGSFDAVVLLDTLQYAPVEEGIIAECHRVLKPTGHLIVDAPHAKRMALLAPFRKLLAVADDRGEPARAGYTSVQLYDVLKDGFDVPAIRTYSRFSVELLNLLANLVAAGLCKKDRQALAAGMGGEEAAVSVLQKTLNVCSKFYPLFWLASNVDGLFFLSRGYHLIARAKRHMWHSRRAPVLSDGRSIAEAALQSKIGTAAPF